jgi:hypothetical protein
LYVKKGNVVPVLISYALKTFGEVEIYFNLSVLDGGEQSDSCPGRFIPGEGTLVTYWLGGWVGHRVGLDAVDKGKKNLTLPGIEPGLSKLSRLLVIICTTHKLMSFTQILQQAATTSLFLLQSHSLFPMRNELIL